MGVSSSISGFGTESFSVDGNQVGVHIPIPDAIYSPIRAYLFAYTHTKKKRKYTEPIVGAFLDFINTPAKINTVYDVAASSDTWFVQAIMDHYNRTETFREFWAKRCRAHIISRQVKFMRVLQTGDDARVVSPAQTQTFFDTNFVQSAMYTAFTTNTRLILPIYIIIAYEDPGEHANMCVISFDKQRVRCVIFEPHAVSAASAPTVKGMRKFIQDVIDRSGKQLKLTVTSPWSAEGLQGDAPVCVQWSLLMFLTYILNCQMGRCNLRQMRNALDAVWALRHVIMPVWLFYVHTILFKDVASTGDYLDADFEPGSEIDPFNCHTQSAPCHSPCAKGKNGVCFNALLFNPML